MKTILLTLALIALANIGKAELKWEKTEVELHPVAGDATAVGTFKYKNTGDKPLKISSVKTSCGCTTAALQKNDVAPGESGEITATFKIGGSTGTQVKTVTVQTDDASQPATVLQLRAVIAQPITLRPSFLYWMRGESPKPKRIAVTLDKGIAAKTLKVTSSSPTFTASVASSSANEFQIEVTPHDTAEATSATFTIAPDSGGKVAYANARIIDAAAR